MIVRKRLMFHINNLYYLQQITQYTNLELCAYEVASQLAQIIVARAVQIVLI